jgi:single-strand DNA-binding protein
MKTHEEDSDMSDNFNVVTLVGRIGQDPDLKTFESGALLTKTSLAVNRKKGEEPDWFSLELWNKQAEVMANFCQKGSLISVQGELKFDEWVAQDGTPRSKVVIKVNKLELLTTGNNNQVPTPTSENYNNSDF